MPPSQKPKALAATVAAIEKQYGEGAVRVLAGGEAPSEVSVIPSGSVGLDRALGIGGWPRGRLVEVFGQEACGKTTLALHAIAQAQALGGVGAFIDAEHSLDARYARALGVRVGELLLCQPDTAEQALEMVRVLVTCGAVDVVVLDSLAALVPRVELEGSLGDDVAGIQARLISQAMTKLTGLAGKSTTCVLFINQQRTRPDAFGGAGTSYTPGGNALKYYASVRCEVRRVGHVKDGEVVVGSRIKVKVVKSKLAPPFGEADFDVLSSRGINRPAEVVDLAVEAGLLEKAGSLYWLQGQRLGLGRTRVIEYLLGHPDQLEELARQLTSRSLPALPASAGLAGGR